MKIPVYGVLLVAAVLALVSTIRKRSDEGIDRKIDIVAYSLMVLGLAVLFVTCIAEAVTGGPLIRPA